MPLKVHCPLCKQLTPYEDNPFRPFCSERCKKTDLGTWASEGYVITGKGLEIDEENIPIHEIFQVDDDSKLTH